MRLEVMQSLVSYTSFAHIRQSGPDSGLGIQVQVLKTFRLKPLKNDPSSLGSECRVHHSAGGDVELGLVDEARQAFFRIGTIAATISQE